MDEYATSQDILNLANAYAVIHANRSIGGGYEISKSYCDGILSALSATTERYKKELMEAAHGKD